MKKFRFFLFFLFFLQLSYAQKQSATVVRVKDGDTFILRLEEGQMIDVRLNGIDCPEKNQPFGQESTASVAFLVNKKVDFLGFSVDRYQRLIADIFYNGKSINQKLVEDGLAWHFREYSTDEKLACAEYYAREAKKGLWSSENPIYPKCWRKGENCSHDSSCEKKDVDLEVTEKPVHATITKKVEEYYVCNSSGSVAYHINDNCGGLRRCTHEIVKMTAEQAEQRRKHACRMCTH
jgi:endonuclease YncB( thermonuclease family)